jgi:serine/threonine protein kinase
MADRTGQQLGNYRIIRQLGRGGFADVYLGEHLYLNTKAAIKVLQTRLADNDLPGFLNEARTIAGLTHTRIVRILDFGVEDDIPFLVMEYAPNGTLRQRYPKGTCIPLVNIVPYIKQVAEALQFAHDRRLIHRDIKPENMLLNQQYEVLLSDFGIAIASQTSRPIETQPVVGTAAYMAPEQLQGKPRRPAINTPLQLWLTNG